MEKKILVAVDGSIYSTNTLHYLEDLFQGCSDIHFHLFSVVPCSTMAAGRQWLDDLELLSSMSPTARHQYTRAKGYLNKFTKQLLRCGFTEKQISSKVQISRAGIANDILVEAKKGLYDALVIGRRGLGKLGELFMGSISKTILDKCHDVPVWVVDGEVKAGKFLMPVDCTPHTLKAADHLCFMIKDLPHAEVTLFHSEAILAQKPVVDPCDFEGQCDTEWCRMHMQRSDSHFHGPRQYLKDNGFPADKIHSVETHKGMYPSRQIVRQALMGDFGTIVMGRRDVDTSKGILGSVSGRVLAMAIDTAVWIVG
jgi:nucleotide-binding universal stress UspA family protein